MSQFDNNKEYQELFESRGLSNTAKYLIAFSIILLGTIGFYLFNKKNVVATEITKNSNNVIRETDRIKNYLSGRKLSLRSINKRVDKFGDAVIYIPYDLVTECKFSEDGSVVKIVNGYGEVSNWSCYFENNRLQITTKHGTNWYDLTLTNYGVKAIKDEIDSKDSTDGIGTFIGFLFSYKDDFDAYKGEQ